jgi:hypothetical protein
MPKLVTKIEKIIDPNEKVQEKLYPIKRFLKQDHNNIPNIKKKYICIYRINTDGLYPFLQYLLYKFPSTNKKNADECCFPFTTKVDFFEIPKKLIQTDYKFEGYLEHDSCFYMFYEATFIPSFFKNKSRNNTLWWVLLDEICNHKCVLNFPIHDSVSSLFLKNPAFLYIYKKKFTPYEIPSVAYNGMYHTLIPLHSSLGLKNTEDQYGSYFYLYSYKKSIKKGGWAENNKVHYLSNVDKNKKYDQGGIIRFAIFLGKMGVTKIEDKWVDDYDSIYINNHTTKNDIKTNYEYVLKYFQQHTPISSHLINMNSLGTRWDEKSNYYIK